MKRALKELGNTAIDRRTTAGKTLAAWRGELIADLGGLETLSAMQLSILDQLVRTRLILDTVDRQIIEAGWITNKRKRSVWPIVRERQAIADSLVRHLQVLGLDRKSKDVPDLRAYLAEHDRAARTAERIGPAVQPAAQTSTDSATDSAPYGDNSQSD